MKYAVIRTKKKMPDEVSFYTDTFEVCEIREDLQDARNARLKHANYWNQEIGDFLIIQVW